MKEAKKKRLRKAGWRVGSAADFLGLSPEEQALIDIRLALAAGLRDHRIAHNWTQSHVARRCRSSQSRVAKMEAGDPSVSIDLLLRCLLQTGVSRRAIAKLITRKVAR